MATATPTAPPTVTLPATLPDDVEACHALIEQDRHLLEVGCWAHARRKFFESKTTDPVRANEALLRIGKLYVVEREAKENALDPAGRQRLRQDKATPLLDAFHDWMIERNRAKRFPRVRWARPPATCWATGTRGPATPPAAPSTSTTTPPNAPSAPSL